MALLYANFRLFRIPLIYLPYANVPEEKSRQSGFLMPEISKSSIKGTILGDAYYWAPTSWADAMLGAQLFTLAGLGTEWRHSHAAVGKYHAVGELLWRGGPARGGRPLAEHQTEYQAGRAAGTWRRISIS